MDHFFKKLLVLVTAAGLTLSMGLLSACGGDKNQSGSSDTTQSGGQSGSGNQQGGTGDQGGSSDQGGTGTEKTLVSIDVKVPNTRYEKGKPFSAADWTVTASYSDGTTSPVPLSQCTFTDVATNEAPVLDKSGDMTVRVSYNGKTKDVTITVSSVIQFTTAQGADEDYLYEQESSAFSGEEGFRYADGSAFFTYELAGTKGSRFTGGYFECVVDNEYSISVSVDNATWEVIGEGATGDSRKDNNEESFDCAMLKNFGDNHGKLYVKFADANPDDGYGPRLRTFTFWYTEETDPNPPAEEIVHTLTFETKGGADELKWIWNDEDSQVWENNAFRYTDEARRIAYAFDLGSALKSLTISVQIRNQYLIEYSFDGTDWEEGATNDTTSDSFSKATVRPASLEGNDGKVYLRFSDSSPSGGMGGGFTSIELSYVLENEDDYAEPVQVQDELLSIDVTPPSKLAYNVGDTLDESGMEVYGVYKSGSRKKIESGYTVTGYEKDSAGTQTITVSYEGKEDTFQVTVADFKNVTLGGEGKKLYETDTTFLVYNGASTAGDGTHRFADEQQAWAYGIDAGGAITKANVSVTVKGDILFSVSKDGIAWTDLITEKLDDGATRTFALSDDILQGNSGKLYFRFGDNTPADGFGGQCTAFVLSYLGGEGEATKAELPFTDIKVTFPTTLAYQVGETLNLEGLAVAAVNGDDEVGAIAQKYLSVKIGGAYYGNTLMEAGSKKLEVRYMDAFKETDVTVTASEDPDHGTIAFTPAQEGEKKYLDGEMGSGTSPGDGKRWADEDKYFIYKFDKSAFGKFATAEFVLTIENEYKIEVSFDKNDWTELGSSSDHAVKEARTFNVAETLAEKFAENAGVIYLRISDAVPTDGFGGCLYGLTFNYTMEAQA